MFSKKNMKGLQKQYESLMSDISAMTVTGYSSGQLIEVTLSGKYELVGIKIKPECVDPEEVEALEDLIKEAFNDANEKIQSQMSSMMPGLGGF